MNKAINSDSADQNVDDLEEEKNKKNQLNVMQKINST